MFNSCAMEFGGQLKKEDEESESIASELEEACLLC